eukprot:TRINITY_DN582_c0_g1_i2.p1 TRINITY_DN582_c0_g1~~TRINITY_DN582_c0_g1_i2.p1  ORF type:complete len:108 (+),score=27.10 TRINITY_DN582_c0_g1_i2:267-590(+)
MWYFINYSHILGALGVLVVYDITNEDSYRNITQWLQEIERYSADDVVVAVAGNKSDLENERKVLYEDAQEFVQDTLGHTLFETSAKNSINVEDLFVHMGLAIRAKCN